MYIVLKILIIGLIVGTVSFVLSKIVGAANNKVFSDATKRRTTETQKKLDVIATNDATNKLFAEGIESLNKMLDSKLINSAEYDNKTQVLINDNYNQVIQLIKREEDTKNDALLDEALNKGVISKDEYEQKRSLQSKSVETTNPKLKLDETICPVCKSSLTPEDDSCDGCGLQIRQ